MYNIAYNIIYYVENSCVVPMVFVYYVFISYFIHSFVFFSAPWKFFSFIIRNGENLAFCDIHSHNHIQKIRFEKCVNYCNTFSSLCFYSVFLVWKFFSHWIRGDSVWYALQFDNVNILDNNNTCDIYKAHIHTHQQTFIRNVSVWHFMSYKKNFVKSVQEILCKMNVLKRNFWKLHDIIIIYRNLFFSLVILRSIQSWMSTLFSWWFVQRIILKVLIWKELQWKFIKIYRLTSWYCSSGCIERVVQISRSICD